MQIQGLPPYKSVQKFCLTKNVNCHSELRIMLLINPKDEHIFIKAVGKSISLIFNKEPVAYLDIVEVQVSKGYSRTEVEVLASSASIYEDMEEQYRIFQAKNHKYSDIISSNKLGLNKCELILDKKISSKKYDKIVLQNHESNFAFIKRMACSALTRLWVKDTLHGKNQLIIKNILDDSTLNIKDEEIIKLIKKNTKEGKSLQFVSRKYINLGRLVKFADESASFVITGMQVMLEHRDYRFHYILDENKDVCDQGKNIYTEKNTYLLAKVRNQDDPERKGRLQVDFIEEGIEDVESKTPRWLPCFTPYTGKESGIIFIPDKDDIVTVVFADGECYVTAADRENKLIDEMKSVKDKYIGNNTKQRIFWKEKSLELMSFDNMIYLDKDKIEITIGKEKKTKILLDKNRILLSVDTSTIIMDKDSIKLSGNGGKQELNKNELLFEAAGSKAAIGNNGFLAKGKGKINIQSDGNIDLKGSIINLA